MASHRALRKYTAEMAAKKARRRGFNASTYKKKKGYGVSVTRK